jgi:hypothetical protein
MLWVHDGNYGTYGGRGQSVESNGYWYQSGGHPGSFIHMKGPKWAVNVCDVGMSRADGSYMYSFPMILDDEGLIWGGAPYSNNEQGMGGDTNFDDQDNDGGRNDTGQGMEDNEMFRTRKKIVFQPGGGHRWTDLFYSGTGSSNIPRALNQRGQVYWTGYDGGASVTMNYDYYSEGANSNQVSYFFHLGPRD